MREWKVNVQNAWEVCGALMMVVKQYGAL